MDASQRHVPVMLDRCVGLLAPAFSKPDSVLIDATLGMGGHAEAVLRACPSAMVVGIDRDADALALAGERLAAFGDRFIPHWGEFDDLEGALGGVGATRAAAVLFDLGVSSLQIDDPERGFSYAQDAPLDMRMNRSDPRTAADILREEPEEEISRILKEYGEERYARAIARAIVRARETSPIERSGALNEIVRASIPARARAEGGNPSKRTFQALRIAVNGELDLVGRAIPRAIDTLEVGGRIVALSYHSLEDRLVKRALAAGAELSTPRGMPIVRDEDLPFLRLLTRGAEKASPTEAATNPRAKSVRLRAAERVRESPRRMGRS